MSDQDSEPWFEVDADGSKGSGVAVAEVFESIAEVLRESPEGARYDFDLTVDEVKRGD